jgi:hypothetical protein
MYYYCLGVNPMKKFFTLSVAFVVAIVVFFNFNGHAAEAKVLWGKLELKKGMIGKIVVVKDTELYKWEQPNKLKVIRKLKKGQEYRVYSSKTIQGSLFYGIGGGAYVKKTANVQYVALSPQQFALLIKQALKGDYTISSGREKVPFVINQQKGNDISGWYFYDENDPLPLEGTIAGNVVTVRVYFDDHYNDILNSVSYLQKYKVPKAEIEEVAQQLMNNDDYYMEFQFTIANDPSQFKGQFRFPDLLLDNRYDVTGTELSEPFAIQVKKLD